jgi:hypothetical protein
MKIRSKLFVLLVYFILTSLIAASFVSINVLFANMIREIKAHLEDDLADTMNILITLKSYESTFFRYNGADIRYPRYLNILSVYNW